MKVIPLNTHRKTSSSALDDLIALVQEDLHGVNEIILQRMQSTVPLIPQLAGHLITAGGKRLRPILTLAAARLCGYEGARHRKLAACIEFIHTATLLHDDVVDESTLRRGDETANSIWSNQASVLVGDFLLSRAFQLMVRDGSLPVLGLLSDTSAIISQGEVMQMMAAGNMETDEATYMQIINAKTAALFSAAAAIGGLITERPPAECDALEQYGRSLGLAFQLADDALDYSASQITLGKAIGDDFREGKLTLPVILAYQRAGEQERRFWQRTIGEGEIHEDDLAQAILLIETHQTAQETLERAQKQAQHAISLLDRFPSSTARDALVEAALFSAERQF